MEIEDIALCLLVTAGVVAMFAIASVGEHYFPSNYGSSRGNHAGLGEDGEDVDSDGGDGDGGDGDGGDGD